MNIVLDASAAIEMALNMKHAFLFKEICMDTEFIRAEGLIPRRLRRGC